MSSAKILTAVSAPADEATTKKAPGGPKKDGGGKGRGKGGSKSGGGAGGGTAAGRGSGGYSNGASTLNPNADYFGAANYVGYGVGEGAEWWSAVAPKVAMPPMWTTYRTPDGQEYYYNSHTGLTQWDKPVELMAPPPQPFRPPPPEEKHEVGDGGNRGKGGGGGGGGGGEGGENRRKNNKKNQGGGNKKEGGGGGGGEEGGSYGPPGCNLFAFHLPDDWTDADLHEHFSPHGEVVSAKVMKEVGTGRSRGFGFVSYAERSAAATAVKKMQGYKILGKRLKVEFKKGEQSSAKFEEKVSEALGDPEQEAEVEQKPKKHYPDDERLIGYLKAVSARNTIQTLKESESWAGGKEGEKAEGGDPGSLAAGSLASLLTMNDEEEKK